MNSIQIFLFIPFDAFWILEIRYLRITVITCIDNTRSPFSNYYHLEGKLSALKSQINKDNQTQNVSHEIVSRYLLHCVKREFSLLVKGIIFWFHLVKVNAPTVPHIKRNLKFEEKKNEIFSSSNRKQYIQ